MSPNNLANYESDTTENNIVMEQNTCQGDVEPGMALTKTLHLPEVNGEGENRKEKNHRLHEICEISVDSQN